MNQSVEKSEEVEPVLVSLRQDIRAGYKEQVKHRPTDKVYIGMQHERIESLLDLFDHIVEVHPEVNETIEAFLNPS